MSSSMKFGLLALVGAAAAVPHYNAHSKFHHTPSGGYAGPTDGWNGQNSTIVGPTGTGVAPGPGDESTTQTTTTHTSKATLTETIYVTPVPASEVPTSVAAADMGQSTGPSVCGPATVTVTATNKVTVTVPAGGAESSAYVPAHEAPTSVDDGTVSSYAPVEPHKPSSSVVKEAETTKAVPSKEAPSKETPVEDVPSSTKGGTAYVAPTKVVPTEIAPSSTKITTSSTEAAVPSKHTSATPSSKPTSSPSTGGKRGLLYLENGAVDAKGIASLGHFGWASNWEADVRGDIGNVEFIPTLRSLDRAGEWSAKIDTAVAAGSKVVFTFNEPDIVGQANLSPQAACTAWEDHVADLISKHSGVNFVGPSISSTANNPNMGLGWLTQFQSICPQAVWSVANYHWYGPVSVGFAGFKAYIEEAYAKIGKDFYVTEFGVNEGASAEDSAAFLKEAQAYLDSHPNCLGYSYFAVGSFDPGYGMTTENLLGTAEALTPAGKVYVS